MILRRFFVVAFVCLGPLGFEAHAFAQGADPDAGVFDETRAERDVAASTEPAANIAEEGVTAPQSEQTATTEEVPAEEPAPEPAGGPLEFNMPLFGRTTFGMTSSTWVRYRGNNYDANKYDDDFLSLQQRFDLSLQGENLRLDVRLDAFLPLFFNDGIAVEQSCPEEDASLCFLTWNARPERVTLRWNHDEWTVEAGDHYAVLGRGLALSFRKYDLLGVDNALRGGRITYDSHRFYARLVAGVSNPQNLDPTNLAVVTDPLDVIAGGEVGTRIGANDDVEVSLHAVHINFEDEADHFQSDRQLTVMGWRASAPGLIDGKLALYAEVDAALRAWNQGEDDKSDFGRAVYVSAQLQLERATLLAEWVDYRNYMVAPSTTEGRAYRIYSSMPTMELDGLQRLRAVGNRRGGSLKFDYAFLPGPWSFSLNSLVYGLNEEPEDPWDGSLVTHGWAGVRRFNNSADGEFGWTLDMLLGYRRETFLHDPFGDSIGKWDLDRDVVHGEIDATFASGEHSIEIRYDHRYDREWRAVSYAGFHQGGLALTYTWNVKLAISPSLRWNDEKATVIELRDARDYNFIGGRFYPSIEVRWNFTTSNFVSVFAGSTPGGRLCSGGVCRDVQAFEGVIAQLVMRL